MANYLRNEEKTVDQDLRFISYERKGFAEALQGVCLGMNKWK